MKVRNTHARRSKRARAPAAPELLQRAPMPPPTAAPPPVPAPPEPPDRTSVAGEEDPGAALDAPGDSSHG